jgi:hypothetical protein
MQRIHTLFLIALGLCLSSSPSFAHFLWLVPQKDNGSEVHLYFSEGPEADNPKLLEKVAEVPVEAYISDKKWEKRSFAFSEDRITLACEHAGATAWKLKHTYGTHGRDVKNLIIYTAMSIPCGWNGMSANDRVNLPKEGFTASVSYDAGQLKITLEQDGKPAAAIEFDLQAPNDHQTLTTDATGTAMVDGIQPGVYAIRCLESDPTSGNYNGTDYAAVNHYTTISFRVPDLTKVTPVAISDSKISELPEPVTSFGAATQGNYLYAYGGHTGSAHTYSNEEQFNRLIRWDLSSTGNGKWEEMAEGPRVQGNALIAAKNQVVLMGGFNAENATGEKSRLVSQAGVKRYDLDKKAWESLPDLPEPRSSMDAAILGDTIYVVGGWTMNGNGSETKWLETAWKLTLHNDGTHSDWQPIAAPPFKRRAMAVAAHDGKIFVIGGMNSDGGPTTACATYDPQTNQWTEVDHLAGVPMNGFGAAAQDVDGQLIVTTEDGSIQRWNKDAQTWEIIGSTGTGRFFHRLLPVASRRFVILGGANMDIGKFSECEVFAIAP